MVPLNMTYLHCLQHFLFEHLFNLYYDEETTLLLYEEIVTNQEDIIHIQTDMEAR